MILRQITHDDLGCASYLIGDEDAGVAAVVDPKLDIDEYLRLARYFGVSIEHILETHNHGDHVSGHGRLAAATGASIHIQEAAGPDYEHEAFGDGWELELGTVRVRAVHTPGHRPEHTAFTLADSQRGPEPWAVLTGDTLFVGDIARPDLAVDKREGAQAIFKSLREKLLALPDQCEVWPDHLGGSLCGGPGMDMKVSSTIGYERDHQELLAVSEEGEQATASLGPQPPNFENIVALNRGPLVRESIVMLAAAAATWRKAGEHEEKEDASWERGGSCPPLRLPRDVVAGAIIGFLTGFFGVGGGFLIVPTLAIALAFTMRTAIGTSLAIITATSLIGLAVHLIAGRSVEIGVTLAMTVACVVGALAGASLAPRVPQRALGRAFAVLVTCVAAHLLVSAAFLGGPPAS
jgi:glyoxylase-like metal-dependent hydrolase (beta-lactamase superfamily II)